MFQSHKSPERGPVIRPEVAGGKLRSPWRPSGPTQCSGEGGPGRKGLASEETKAETAVFRNSRTEGKGGQSHERTTWRIGGIS